MILPHERCVENVLVLEERCLKRAIVLIINDILPSGTTYTVQFPRRILKEHKKVGDRTYMPLMHTSRSAKEEILRVGRCLYVSSLTYTHYFRASRDWIINMLEQMRTIHNMKGLVLEW